MPEPKFLSPLMDGLEFGACVQSEGSKSVYLMRDTKMGTVYLLRVFCMPESVKQLDALVFSGAVADRAEALRYYTDQILELRRTLETIKGFADFNGVQVHTDYQIDQLPDDQGFAVYVLAPYLPTLSQHLGMNAMSMLEALNLGIDLSDALFALHESGYLVQNVSLENILITPKNQFVLSNLAIANLDRLEYGTISDDQVSQVSAPELHGLIPSFKHNSDVYALGMVLYYIFNGNHAPFVDENTTPAAALKRRIEGEQLPAPMFADYELGEIILKACAFDPEDRYQGPDELKAALTQYMKRNPVADTLIVPPINSEPEELVLEEFEDFAEADAPVSTVSAEELDESFVQHLSPSAAPAKETEEMELDEDELLNEKLDALITDDGPVNEAHDAAPIAPQKKKKNYLIAPIISVCAILACAAVLLFLFMRPKPVNVEFLNTSNITANQLSVSMKLAGDAQIPVDENGNSTLVITCSDAYGNVRRQSFGGNAVTFTDLLPGTQYTIGVECTTGKEVTGRTSINATTTPAAVINAISATDLSDSMVTITLSVSGHNPEQWTIHCQGEGLEPLNHTFSGNSIQISGLVSNTTYTCTFEDPSGGPVSGNNTVTFTTEPRLTLESFVATESTVDSIRLAWTYSGDKPQSWNLRCEGSDGSVMEKTVEGLSINLEDLAFNVSYTFTLTAAGMQPTALSTLQISTVSTRIASFEASADSVSSITAKWDIEGSEGSGEYLIKLRISGLDGESYYPVSGNEFTITGLISQTNYILELLDAAGNPITGENMLYVRTPVAEKFTDYGCTNIYRALYLEPSKENWTKVDLKTLRKSFSPGEGIVLAIESINGIRKADLEVEIKHVIRNSDNLPVAVQSRTEQWNELWNGNVLFETAPKAPEETGKYVLELYFNDRMLTSYEFTVE